MNKCIVEGAVKYMVDKVETMQTSLANSRACIDIWDAIICIDSYAHSTHICTYVTGLAKWVYTRI